MDPIVAVKKAIHYDVVQNILRYYECPATCNEYCCRKGKAHMLEDELNILTSLDPKKAGKIIPDEMTPGLYIMNNPCSFLNHKGRCHAYENRPTVCGLYPFKMSDTGSSLGLQPCPVGFMVIRDFFSWVLESISRSDITESEKAIKIEEWKSDLILYEGELAQFQTTTTLKELQIPFIDLEMLAMFLASKKSHRGQE